MKIPDEAVEAALMAVREAMIKYGPDGHTDGDEQITRAALEAAAPYMEDAAYCRGFDDGHLAGQESMGTA